MVEGFPSEHDHGPGFQSRLFKMQRVPPCLTEMYNVHLLSFLRVWPFLFGDK